MARKTYDDDDGRTIADMSGIERQPMLLPRLPKKEGPPKDEPQGAPDPEQDPVPKRERRMMVLGGMSAAALIAVIFIAAAAIIIGLMLLIWSR